MDTEKTTHHELSPGKIILDTFAFARTRILSTAIDLELFTHISKGKKTLSELAQATKTQGRPLEILLNTLCAMEYLQKKDRRYELTSLSRFFLVKGKKMYYGDYVKHSDLSWDPWLKLTEVIRSGKPSLPTGTAEREGFDYYQQLVPLLFNTTHLVAVAGAKALGIGGKLKGLKIIDVGTGSGAWGIAMAQEDPSCHVYGVDDEKVLEQTKRHVEQFGLGNQFHYIPANIEEDTLGEDEYDLAILSYVCHLEGERKSREILSNIYKSLKKGGRIVICEVCPDENREKDLFPLIFGVNMLIHTPEGNTFTLSEYTSWLKEAGFKRVETIDIPATSPLMVAIK
jgi:2-polyprenyl-3-methyl-5-hydroxy-6-metoxy-1,4-benzoquinol methylase